MRQKHDELITQHIRPNSKPNGVTIFVSLPREQNRPTLSALSTVKFCFEAVMILDSHSVFSACIRDSDKQPLGCCAAFSVGIKALHGSLMSNQSSLHNAEFTPGLTGLWCFGQKQIFAKGSQLYGESVYTVQT